jgi:hypothetical protein
MGKRVKGLYSLHNETLGALTVPLTFQQGQPNLVNGWFYIGVKDGQSTPTYGLTTECVPSAVNLPG